MPTTSAHFSSRIAYCAAILFTLSLARFFIVPRLNLPPTSPILMQLNAGLLPVAAHLILFPLIAELPAPTWAKAAGYGWLVIDTVSNIMALNGLSDMLYLPIKYGGHISAALWIVTAAWYTSRFTRWTGLLLALNLAAFSFIPHGPLVLLYPTAFLLPLWFVLIGRYLAHRAHSDAEVRFPVTAKA